MRDSEFLSVTPQAWIGAAVMLLLIPFPWLSAWFIAAFVHELSHCLALVLCGAQIRRVQIGCRGARIETDYLSEWKTVLCALAGPLGGLLLMFFARHFPRLTVCAFFQSLYNLLPVYPLDGGRALRASFVIFRRYRKKTKRPCN